MTSRHSTKYRDSSANIKVLLRQQTSMTLNERFHKIMKMPPAAPPPRARSPPPPRDSRIREELRAHQRKLESLERNTLQMMSRSLSSIPPPIQPVSVPTAPVYQPPKPPARDRLAAPQQSAKARLGRAFTAQSRVGAKRLTQKYAKQRTTSAPVSKPPPRNSFNTRGSRGGSRATSTGRGATRGTTRGGGGGRGTSRGGRGGSTRGGRGGKAKLDPADKDTLDNELDKYMSKSRAYLDDQLDSYMAQKGDKETAKS